MMSTDKKFYPVFFIIVTAPIYYVLFKTALNKKPYSLWFPAKNVLGNNGRDLAAPLSICTAVYIYAIIESV